MKILHITASYKPAYIYGGPIYSVAALCEGLVKRGVGSRKSEVGGPGSGSDEPLNKKDQTQYLKKWLKVQGHYSAVKEEKKAALSVLRTSLPEGEHEVMVYTTLANGKGELNYSSGEVQMVEGVPVRYFKRWTKDHSHFSPSLLWFLWKNSRKYEVIHIHSWWNLVSMGSVLVCLLRGVKPIVSPRGMLGDYTFTKSKMIFHQVIGKFLLRRCDFHATTMMEAKEIAFRVGGLESEVRSEIIDLMEEEGKSEVGSRESEDGSRKSEVGSTKSEVRSLGNKEVSSIKYQVSSRKSKEERAKIFVIHNIVKISCPLPPKTRVFDGTLHLIFLSRIHPKKGVELLLEALAEVDFSFSLSIVGEGKDDYVESLKVKVESLNLSHGVHWKGAIYGNEKFQLLAAHDLLVLPSFNENFANVVIESIAVGTPVLISDQVGLHHYISQHHLGLVHQLTKDSLLNKLNQFKEIVPLDFSIPKDFSSLPLVEKYMNLYHA